MNLISDLQNDLALAFLVEKKHSETLDSSGVKAIMDQITQVLLPLSDEDRPTGILHAGAGDEGFLSH